MLAGRGQTGQTLELDDPSLHLLHTRVEDLERSILVSVVTETNGGPTIIVGVGLNYIYDIEKYFYHVTHLIPGNMQITS